MVHVLSSLRHAAKEILAVAVCELFPGTQLLGGGISEIDFSYRFRLPVSAFGERELTQVEDQMRRIAFEKRPIEQLEMMTQNASTFLAHLGQKERAEQVLSEAENIVSLLKIGPFYDLSPPPYPPHTGEAGALKLLSWTYQEKILTITGAAFPTKDQLKDFLKAYRQVEKQPLMALGERLKLFIPHEGELLFLPAGEELRQSLIGQWRTMHREMGVQFIHASSGDSKKAHLEAFARGGGVRPSSYASLGGEETDLTSFFCERGHLKEQLISSLRFIEQTIKIFELEARVVFLSPRKGGTPLLREALEGTALQFTEEFAPKSSVEFRILDRLGRSFRGPFVEVDEERAVVFQALFGSMVQWVLRMVERMVDKERV